MNEAAARALARRDNKAAADNDNGRPRDREQFGPGNLGARIGSLGFSPQASARRLQIIRFDAVGIALAVAADDRSILAPVGPYGVGGGRFLGDLGLRARFG